MIVKTVSRGMCVWGRRVLRHLTIEKSITGTGVPKDTIVRLAPIRKDHARLELTQSSKELPHVRNASPANKAHTMMLLVSLGVRSVDRRRPHHPVWRSGPSHATVLVRTESSLSRSVRVCASVASDQKTIHQTTTPSTTAKQTSKKSAAQTKKSTPKANASTKQNRTKSARSSVSEEAKES